jgi:FAD/FMN-containing dehydrogenase
VCLEFFGQAREAIPSIVEITQHLEAADRAYGVKLAGLEHLDERYLRAVGYATKSKRAALPKMVLIGDIVGDDDASVAKATSEVVRIANARGGEGFIAVGADARKKFWLDRARTAAIAKHTNAFKINEDVVIPLARLGDYTDAIERINIELSITNKLRLIDALEEYLRGELKLNKTGDAELDALSKSDMLGDRPARAKQVLVEIRNRWGDLLHRIDQTFAELQDRSIRVSWKRELREPLFDPPAHLEEPGLGRSAYACGRWERTHQHSGQLGRLLDAAGGECRRGAHHEDRA